MPYPFTPCPARIAPEAPTIGVEGNEKHSEASRSQRRLLVRAKRMEITTRERVREGKNEEKGKEGKRSKEDEKVRGRGEVRRGWKVRIRTPPNITISLP